MDKKKEPISMMVEERFKRAAETEAKRRGTSVTGLFKQLVNPFIVENVAKDTIPTHARQAQVQAETK